MPNTSDPYFVHNNFSAILLAMAKYTVRQARLKPQLTQKESAMSLILTPEMLEKLVAVLMVESREAWEAGLQNCPGPVTREEAIIKIHKAVGLND